MEDWKKQRFPRLFSREDTDTLSSRKEAARRKTQTLETAYRKLKESQDEVLYLVAGENSSSAAEMLNWPISQFYAAQNTQYKVISERVKAAEEKSSRNKRTK